MRTKVKPRSCSTACPTACCNWIADGRSRHHNTIRDCSVCSLRKLPRRNTDLGLGLGDWRRTFTRTSQNDLGGDGMATGTFATLFESCIPHLRAYARSLVHDPDAADD